MNTITYQAPLAYALPSTRKLYVAPISSELTELVSAKLPSEGIYKTDIAGLELFRVDAPTSCMPTVYEPSLCVIAQGRTTVQLGDHDIVYGALSCMMSSVELPADGRVVDASPEHPFLAVKINMDLAEVAELVLQLGNAATTVEASDRPYSECGLWFAQVDMGMLDALIRLVRLLDAPTDAPILAPLIRREIVYRVLIGEEGARIREFVSADSQLNRISRVISMLKDRFAETLRARDLAKDFNMSESTFYHSFKQVTRMSPLQFQKRLRLHEARRLMLREGLEAATASFRVGYESPSHFSREYRRMFGAPPRADVVKLRGETGMGVSG
ncbi:AraC family transcriptional regulator [Pseudomonas sp. OIL-1]|uniref:AraC family transcriptional regulator n=1 Tax=Pseudomonas sp. OIL-1 TaxID=2706126 RepID=UPI0013A72968|nr:AraC family transcriptional regulator [Pseudomonas sp. OIL-1]QIB52338.1 AraC family transcriptional regulator [Pseudomonas sp. OIL-1]